VAIVVAWEAAMAEVLVAEGRQTGTISRSLRCLHYSRSGSWLCEKKSRFHTPRVKSRSAERVAGLPRSLPHHPYNRTSSGLAAPYSATGHSTKSLAR
jgi:hypothetical protein